MTLPQRYVLSVTQDHISRGRNTRYSCPVALALHTLWPIANVSTTLIFLIPFQTESEWQWLVPSPDLKKWIGDFDHGDLVQPIDLEIDLDAHTISIVFQP